MKGYFISHYVVYMQYNLSGGVSILLQGALDEAKAAAMDLAKRCFQPV
jgi:hypothetical protein